MDCASRGRVWIGLLSAEKNLDEKASSNLTDVRKFKSSGSIRGNPSCHKAQDARYAGEFLSIFSTE